MARLKLAVLISGRGSNLQALIDACAAQDYPARIVLVVSNVADAGGLQRAERAAIPTRIVEHKGYADRDSFDAALTQAIAASGAELVCLAGFMRLLTDGFCTHWRDRLINIHPSLLPAFKGLHTHERVLAAGVRISGCSVHFVRPAMDEGPIIAQAAVPVGTDDNAETLATRVLQQEHRLYPLAVRLIAEGRVTVRGEHAEIAGAATAEGSLINPL